MDELSIQSLQFLSWGADTGSLYFIDKVRLAPLALTVPFHSGLTALSKLLSHIDDRFIRGCPIAGDVLRSEILEVRIVRDQVTRNDHPANHDGEGERFSLPVDETAQILKFVIDASHDAPPSVMPLIVGHQRRFRHRRSLLHGPLRLR